MLFQQLLPPAPWLLPGWAAAGAWDPCPPGALVTPGRHLSTRGQRANSIIPLGTFFFRNGEEKQRIVGRGIVESQSLGPVWSPADTGRVFTPAAGSHPQQGEEWVSLSGEGRRKGVTPALGEVPPRLARTLLPSNRLHVPAP